MAFINGHKYDDKDQLIPPDRYDIYKRRDRGTGEITHEHVGEAKTKNGANRAIDRRDNKHGSYAHYAVPIYADAKRPQDT